MSYTRKPALDAFRAAFPYTIPMMTGFLFLGVAYGIYMKSLGFNALYPILMAATIYAGSVEFIVAGLLITDFDPWNTFLIALMVSGRQFFYSISMLTKYSKTGKKKGLLIATLVDESFSLNYLAKIPPHIDRGWYMLSVSLLLYTYWVTGAALGALFGTMLPFDLKGVEFAMTALFIVIFAEQWIKEKSHASSLLGIGVTVTCLLIFGKNHFLLPTLFGIWLILTLFRSQFEAILSRECHTETQGDKV
ncbi:AzlC family ABC transporter permease [Pelistega ratti]|uniref:AzlC family ABC transporter permease n=1 Tax=Pelistega ratti TaxID=2652177 RepID=UPI0013577C50|nr:AzlC family ABC transporter permease [Pelistega ratti]